MDIGLVEKVLMKMVTISLVLNRDGFNREDL